MTDAPMHDPQLIPHYAALNAERRLPRRSRHTLRAAWWAYRAVRRAKHRLKTDGLATKVAPPPPLPWGSRTGVDGVLSRLEPTCLERSLVLQAWLTAHGIERDIVIGVASDDAGVRAHAWIEGDADSDEGQRYTEIHRILPR